LSEEEFSRLRSQAIEVASAAGDLIEIERVDRAGVQEAARGVARDQVQPTGRCV
jgi:hypothetical protein